MRVLITGGAGFVGSSLALLFRREHPKAPIVAFDNLKRRGSELNLARLAEAGVEFCHGDIRNPSDLADLVAGSTGKGFDLLVEASAEPSVHAGTGESSPQYAIQTNLVGTANCLEFARRHCEAFLFLSTSRVYSIPALRGLSLREESTRFEWDGNGVSEGFPTDGYRSIYGTTKLASELLIQEYAHAYNLKSLINRCGVIAGPGQFGKVDQGVFTLWVARHHFGKSLRYTGFGGTGKQVRDLLHPEDLFRLISAQLSEISSWSADVYNVGGGRSVSASLLEWTELCEKVTGRQVPMGAEKETAGVDVPYYVTDAGKASREFGWAPERSPLRIAQEILDWIRADEDRLKPVLGG